MRPPICKQEVRQVALRKSRFSLRPASSPLPLGLLLAAGLRLLGAGAALWISCAFWVLQTCRAHSLCIAQPHPATKTSIGCVEARL